MSCTPATLKEELPAFADVADETIQKWLNRAAKKLSPDTWGALYDEGQMFLAAHSMVCMGLVAGVTVDAPAVKKKQVGPISIEYAVNETATTESDDLDLTVYGREYKALRKTLYRGPMAL